MKDPKTSLTVEALLFSCCTDICIDSDKKTEKELLNLAKDIYLGYKSKYGEYLELPHIYLFGKPPFEDSKMTKQIKSIFKTLKIKEK